MMRLLVLTLEAMAGLGGLAWLAHATRPPAPVGYPHVARTVVAAVLGALACWALIFAGFGLLEDAR